MSATPPAPFEPTEIIAVHQRSVACDGAKEGVNAALGHPRVWLRIADHDVLCPYCSRLYVLKGDVHDEH